MSRPGEPDRLAGGREAARPASQAVIASAVTGPTPYSRAVSALAPVRCRAAAASRGRSSSRRAFQAGEHVQGGGDLQLPGGDRCAAAAARTAAAPRLVRSVPALSCGPPWRRSTAWMRCTQAVCSARRS